METSQNGWPASPNLATRVIEPVKGCRLRVLDNDNVADIFTYLVQQYHRRVDDVTKPHPADDWGFYYRPNKNNPNELSNHSSATAIDLDATEHPNGVATKKTYTARQIEEVHKILAELEGVVRWGGDYHRTPDAMHFEINVKPGQLQKVGQKVRNLMKEPTVAVPLFTTRVATLNLMQYPKNRRLPETLKSVNGCKIVGIQEANRPAFKKQLKRRWPNIIGLGHLDQTDYGTPLVVNKNVFNYVQTGTRIMYRTAKGISRTRHLTWAVAEHRATKQKIGVINLHAVDVKNDQLKARRLSLRSDCKAALRKQIEIFQAQGLPIIVLGDFNDIANWLGSTIGGQRVQRVRHRVDQILTIDSKKTKWRIEQSSHVDTPSNHDTLRAKLTLLRR